MNHIKPKNIIITDGWSSYQFLDDTNFEYKHEVHRLGSHSTSHIEGIWGTIKQYIKKTYNYIPCKNFIFYLREAEFRYMIHDLNPDETEIRIIEVFEYLYDSSEFELYDEKTLIDNDNYDF